ncbi:MAG: hypothetical protein ABSD68_02050 [Candidatus Micrarchaeales archaeon]
MSIFLRKIHATVVAPVYTISENAIAIIDASNKTQTWFDAAQF